MIENLLAAKGEDRILLLSGGPKSHVALGEIEIQDGKS